MKIMIFSAHPDDETLATAGIIKRAINNNDDIKVVIANNGDYFGKEYGQTRIVESTNAITFLGVKKENIIFLGYGDTGMPVDKSFLIKLYTATSDTQIYPSHVGTQTYGLPGFADDYHSSVYGVPGDYNKKTFVSDVQSIVSSYMPDHIYVTSIYDTHGDHSAIYRFIVDIIIEVKKQNPGYCPKLHETLVHACEPCGTWPKRETDPSPLAKFTKPLGLDQISILKWEAKESVPVPPSMQIIPRPGNEKYKAIHYYKSQWSDYLFSFVKSNEFFWKRNFYNIAPLAQVSASSENSHTGQQAIHAVDGIRDGYPRYQTKEWATDGELSGAWIKLSWKKSYFVDRIMLYDRPNTIDHILKATLSFSDGSSLSVGPLKNDGSGDIITFPGKFINWVQLTIDQAAGTNIGLSEFEVYSPNVAHIADVTVSSENSSSEQLGIKAVDGNINGYPGIFTREWATRGELAGAWIKLSWPSNYVVDQIVLYDRPNLVDWIQKATLEFSDGTSLTVGPLKNDGGGDVITFTPKSINWVKLTVDQAIGKNIGLSEFEVYCTNIARVATVETSSETLNTSQTGIKAIDGIKDGYPNDYTKEWATNRELAGAWIKLSWLEPYEVDHILLYDRPNLVDHIEKATLAFSDGSSVNIDSLYNNGSGNIFTFAPKKIDWIKLTVDQAAGLNIGLSEFEVYSNM